ncbi:hypothetical protein ACS0TY_006646 [Phlomoides rotata]
MDQRLENLNIGGDEDEECVLEPNAPIGDLPSQDLCLVGKILTDHHVNFNNLKSRLMMVWWIKKGMEMKEIGDGRIIESYKDHPGTVGISLWCYIISKTMISQWVSWLMLASFWETLLAFKIIIYNSSNSIAI